MIKFVSSRHRVISSIYLLNVSVNQTRGLSNLEIKHVGKLAVIGALLKAVETSCGRKITCRLFVGFCCTHITS